MLVLTRYREETIHMTTTEPIPAGTRIVVRVVDFRGRGARLGIDAPNEVLILRGELQEVEDRNQGREGR